MMPKSWRCSGRILPLALLIALVAVPVEARRGGREARPETWDARLAETDGHLVGGRFRPALALSEKLVDEMEQTLGAGEGASRAMGTAVGYLALAEAGRGDEADALWHWPLALSLRPDLADWDLGRYGAAGELIERRRDEWRPTPPKADAAAAERVEETIYRSSDEDVVPPRKLRSPAPQATAALRAMADDGEEVIVSFVVGHDGSIRMPRVLKHQYPGYAFVVVETVRRWRFEPARVRGEPVDVYYNLTIRWQHND
jgi:hypothetical protein